MKRIFCLLLLINKLAFGQIGFEKTYQFLTNVESANACIQDDDGGFVIGVGPVISTPMFLRDYGLIKLNQFGDTAWQTTFYMNYNASLQLVKKAPDKGYISIGLADDSVSGNQLDMLWICKFDSLGYLTWSRFYSNPQFNFAVKSFSAEFVNSKQLLICDGLQNFILLDSTYNFLSLKKYPFFQHNFSDEEESISYNSNFWYYTLRAPVLFGPYTVRFLEIDQNGDSIKSIQVINDTLGEGKIVKATNSYFIAIGYKTLSSLDVAFFVSKIDTSGTKLWSKRLAPPWGLASAYQYSSYSTLLNGNHVVCFLPSANAIDRRSFIYCFNDNGDSLWTQYFKDDTTYSTRLLDVVATADSGLVACGQITEPGGALKDYIVKTNSNGLILNTVAELQKKETNYVHLYPNPANSYTNIHYVGTNKNVNLSITNLQGQVIYREQLSSSDQRLTLNTTNFPPGFYFCNISAEGKNLLSKKLVVLNN